MTALAETPAEEILWDSSGVAVQALGAEAIQAAAADDEPKAVIIGEDVETRDVKGFLIHNAGREPLLDAEQEVDLAKRIEAGLLAEKILRIRDPKTTEETALAILHSKNPKRTLGALIKLSESDAFGQPDADTNLQRVRDEGKAARDRFLGANMRLVISLAKRYHGKGLPDEDVIQEGNAGLVRAVEKFDYTKGYKFSTYATWWIRQGITRALSQASRNIRLPVHRTEELGQIKQVRRDLARVQGDEPTPQDMADALDWPVERVEELLLREQDTISLSTQVGDGTHVLSDIMIEEGVPTVEEIVLDRLEHELKHEQVRALLDLLDEESANVLRARFGFDDGHEKSRTAVGKKFGMSHDRVKRIEGKALLHLAGLATRQQAA